MRYDDDERVAICQREIFRLRQVVRKLEEEKKTELTLGAFVNKALSNDLIGIVDDIERGIPREVMAAYRFLLEDADKDILDREVERFTYGKVEGYNRDVLLVKLSEKE